MTVTMFMLLLLICLLHSWQPFQLLMGLFQLWKVFEFFFLFVGQLFFAMLFIWTLCNQLVSFTLLPNNQPVFCVVCCCLLCYAMMYMATVHHGYILPPTLYSSFYESFSQGGVGFVLFCVMLLLPLVIVDCKFF